MKIKLRANQKIIFDRIYENDYSLVVHYMRAGKTLPVCMYVKQHATKALVIAPPNTIDSVWHTEMRTAGVPLEKYTCYSHAVLDRLDFDSKDIAGCDILIIDELHNYRKYSGRTKAMLRLSRRFDKVIGLSATPFESDLKDIFYPLQILDKGELFGTNKSIFEKEFCDVTNPHSNFPKFELKPHLIESIHEYLSAFTTVYRPPEITPPTEFFWYFPLTKDQKRFYRKIDNSQHIPEIQGANLDWTQGIIAGKKRQLASGYLLYGLTDIDILDPDIGYDDRVFHFRKPSAKWKYLVNIMRAIQKEKVVIWYAYIEEMKQARRVLEKELPFLRVAMFGEKTMKRFNEGLEDVLLCHPASAGEGVNLTAAKHAIYLTHPFSAIQFEQSLYRLSAYGDQETKYIHHLLPRHPWYRETRHKLTQKLRNMKDFYSKGKL